MIQSSRYTVRSSIQIRHTLSRCIFEESGSYFGIRTILDLGISDPMYLCIQYRSTVPYVSSMQIRHTLPGY